MSLVGLAAGLAALLLVGLALFHAALALGLPYGRLAWGGESNGALPPRLQWGSALMVPVLLAMALIVLIRVGILYPHLASAMVWPHWAVFFFLVVNTFANFRSDSRDERRIMGPLAAATAALVGYVAVTLG
jgi:TRAP-type uncharacterized transport system fused permease subunit